MLVLRSRYRKLEKKHRKTKKALRKAQLENAVFKERLDIIANYVIPDPPEKSDLHRSEEEEDLEYQFKAGMIGKDAYEEMLKEIGAMNAEIEFDSSTFPRLI